jgi:hypothetical protein
LYLLAVYLPGLAWQNLVWTSVGNLHQATNSKSISTGAQYEIIIGGVAKEKTS